jgi:hypothetical protein
MPTLKLPELARIDQHPAYKAAVDELQRLETRLAQTETRRTRAKNRLLGAKPAESPLERARELLRGGIIEGVDPKGDLVAAEAEEMEVLRPAIRAATAELDAVAADLSFAASEKVRPHYTAAVKAALQAMTDLAAALDTLGAVRAHLRERGYTPSEGILPSGVPHSAILLGSPAAIGNSQAWVWQDLMRRHGLV